MKLSNGEKLILLMLSELHEKLDVKSDIDTEFIRSAIFNDQLWGIEWKYPGIPFEQTDPPETVREVVNILEMWRSIEDSYLNLSDTQKDELTKINGFLPKFSGFDGNNESDHLSATSFLINDLERFIEFKNRNLNSHCPSIEFQRRMLNKFSIIRGENYRHTLTFEELSGVLKEIIHPSNRTI